MKTKISELEKLEELILNYRNESDKKKKYVAYLNLIEESLKLVKRIVMGMYPIPNTIAKDDLIQVGAVGVLKAIETYDISIKGSFKTYVSKVIKGKVLHYLRDKASIVKTPRETIANMNKVKEAIEELSELSQVICKLKRWTNHDKTLRKDVTQIFGELKEELLQKSKTYRENHKEEKRLNDKFYRETHKKERNKKQLQRKESDPVYKLKCSVRCVLKDSFRRKKLKKNMKGEKILGCTIEYFINYLIKTYENNYKEKWDWKYLKDVHIDHIIPLASANTEEEVIKLCHYTNLQLLKAEDNLNKKDKLDWRI